METIEVKPSPELAYFIGVMQGDGCRYSYTIKSGIDKGRVLEKLELVVKDIEMIKKAKDIFDSIFARKTKMFKMSTGYFKIMYSVKSLEDSFKILDIDFKDPPKPPTWVKEDVKFFGPYLAGVIDADGSVSIKRPKYPQCRIRIISGSPQLDLEKSIETLLGCGASIYKLKVVDKKCGISGFGFDLDFVLSSKITPKFVKYVLPYIQIPRKREMVIKYLKIISN